MLIQSFWGICFLPNSKFSLADSIDFTNRFSENVFSCVFYVWLTLVPELGSEKGANHSRFSWLPLCAASKRGTIPSKGLR